MGEEDELEEDGKDAGVPGRCEVETSACDDTGRDTGVECFMRWNGGRVGIRRQYKSGSSTGRRERRGDSVCVCVCRFGSAAGNSVKRTGSERCAETGCVGGMRDFLIRIQKVLGNGWWYRT